jgi:ferredoxin
LPTVHADADACVGSGLCSFISEKYFSVGDHPAVVAVLHETVDEADRPVVEQAVTSCPAQALRLADD